MKGYMYILKCADDSYYTGSTTHLELRLQQHQNGEGANHTKKHLPVELLYYEEYNRIDLAFYREKQVQGWSRKKKESLIQNRPDDLHLLSVCQNETHFSNFQKQEPSIVLVSPDNTVVDSTPLVSASLVSASLVSAPLNHRWSFRCLSEVEGSETQGNTEILKLPKTAFLCSRKIPASVVLKCYDWAIEQRESGVCIISGFHSQIEKDVLHYLLKGKQPIILALARGLKEKVEPEFEKALEQGRLLIISPFDKTTKRVTEQTAETRNKLMIDLADNITVGYASEGGQLEKLLTSTTSKQINKIQ